jgi:hypothetical protein
MDSGVSGHGGGVPCSAARCGGYLSAPDELVSLSMRRSARNALSLVATTIRSVEADNSMDPAQRARLLFYGAQVLMTAIGKCDYEKKLDEMITTLRELKKAREEPSRAEERR